MTGPDPAATTIDPAPLAALAANLARQAGRAIVEQRAEAVATTTTKSSPTDPVTEADRAAERAIVDGILRSRPADGIVGEEGAQRIGTSGLDWYIDPIDGTTNYVYGIPAFAVSIAVGDAGGVVAGVVYNPVADELFEARSGGGATLNGQTIAVGRPVELASALVATGFGYRAERRRLQAAVVAELLPDIRDIRRFGSAALDLCAVACGRVDAYYEIGLNVWDFAAGALVAAEAGARCSDLGEGAPSPEFVLAAGPSLHADLGRRLRSLHDRHRPV